MHEPVLLAGKRLRSLLRNPLAVLFLLIFVLSLGALWRVPLPTERVVPLNINYVNLANNLIVLPAVVETVELNVQGPRHKVESLTTNSLTCDLDLTSTSVGIHSLAIPIEHISLPVELDLISIRPSSITLKIDEKIKRTLPIVIRLEGQPVIAKKVTQIVADPASLMVEGPQSILANLDRIVSKPVNIQGASETIKRDVALDLPESLIAVDDRRLTLATIEIRDVIHRRQYRSVPVQGIGARGVYEIIPPTIDLEIKGPAQVLENLQTGDNLKAFVKLAGMQPGVYKRRASIHLPVGVRLLQATPELFIINIGRYRARDDREFLSPERSQKLFGMRSWNASGN
jgi:YbbR domain-containing protein